MDPGAMPEHLSAQNPHHRRAMSPMTITMAQSPDPPIDFDSCSSTEYEAITPAEEEISTEEPIEQLSLCTWRGAHTLKNQNGTKIETPTAPALVFWHGQLWLSYRTTGNRILLGVRTTNEPGTNTYHEYDLSADTRVRAKSDHPPALAGFKGRLYIAWKSEGPNHGIWYQRTDGAGNWNPSPIYIGASFQTSSSPVLQVFDGKLYMAWLAVNANADHTYDIWFSTTSDGVHWTPPVRQKVNENNNYGRSPYFPDFSILNGTLYLFWGSGPTRGDQVYYAPVHLGSIVTLSAVHGGSWRTKIGNALVYRIGQQWIFTTGLDGGIWVATGAGWASYCNLRNSAATAVSSHSPSAAIVPGYPGGKPWRIFLVWKNQGSNNTLWESSHDI